jgi:prevent-host-death family protein
LTVTQLRSDLGKLLAQKRMSPRLVTQRGRPRAVLMSARGFNWLIDRFEYLDDSLEAALAHERLEKV